MSFGISFGDFAQAFQLARKLRQDWSDSPGEYASISNEITNIKNILEDVEALSFRATLTTQQQDKLQHASTACIGVLQQCEAIVASHFPIQEPATGKTARLRRGWERFKLDPNDIRHARDRLATSLTQLCAIRDDIQRNFDSKWLGNISHEVNQIQLVQQRERIKQVANWFSADSFAEKCADQLKLHQAGTGAWFLNDQRYLDWRANPGCTLLCPGMPGSGKSVMFATVVEDLGQYFSSKSDNVAICYFLCNFQRQEEQDLPYILSKLARQLFEKQQVLPQPVSDLYDRYHHDAVVGTRPVLAELMELLGQLIQLYRRVFILVDALDECSNNDMKRNELLNRLRQVSHDHSDVSQLFTTRYFPDITEQFTSATCLDVSAHRQDVEHYLDTQILAVLPGFVQRRKDLQSMVKERNAARVDGMFLLAKLHLDSLQDKTTPNMLRKALENLPRGSEEALFKAYDEIKTRIEQQQQGWRELAKRVLTWVSYSRRELSVRELQEAVVIEDEMSAIENDDLNDINDIVSVCAGSIVVDAKSNIVRLVHFTAQEYQLTVRQEWLPAGNEAIVHTSLSYLSMEFPSVPGQISHQCLTNSGLELVAYIVDNWTSHIPDPPPTDMKMRILTLMIDKKMLEFWVDLYPYLSWDLKAPLHICASLDLYFLVDHLLLEADVNGKDDAGRTAMYHAIEWGSTKTLQALLNAPGVDINGICDGYHTPLMLAMSIGNDEAIEMMLSHPDLDFEQTDAEGYSLLYRASLYKGPLDLVVQVLARQNIDVSVHKAKGVLFMTADNLLGLPRDRSDVEVYRADHFDQTELFHSAYQGHTGYVEMLLTNPDVNINGDSSNNCTPLKAAVARGHVDVVSMLLARPEIDVNQSDMYGVTPLRIALLDQSLVWPALRPTLEGPRKEIAKKLIAKPELSFVQPNELASSYLQLARQTGDDEIIAMISARLEADTKSETEEVVESAD